MKYLKMLGMATVAAMALTMFIGAGTASAAVICSTTADPCPAGQKWPVPITIDFSIPSGQTDHIEDTSGNTLDTCKTSTVKGTLETSDTGPLSELTWGTCTFPTKTLRSDKLKIQKIAGTSNGTLVADGSTVEVTISSILGDCKYGVTAGTSLGDFTEGNPAIIHENLAAVELSSLAACPDTSKWTATYAVTEPSGTTGSISSS